MTIGTGGVLQDARRGEGLILEERPKESDLVRCSGEEASCLTGQDERCCGAAGSTGMTGFQPYPCGPKPDTC